MNSRQALIQTLYAKLNRFCDWMGIALACSWLFAAFSYYLSIKTGFDWFSRSGSLMSLFAAIATFRLLGSLQNGLTTAFKEGLATLDREFELYLQPPKSYRYVLYFAYVTGVLGTAIWGYGDQLLPQLHSSST